MVMCCIYKRMGFQIIVLRGKKFDISVEKLNMSVKKKDMNFQKWDMTIEKDNMTDKKENMADRRRAANQISLIVYLTLQGVE